MNVPPEVYKTKQGTPYLKEAGVVVMAKPQLDMYGFNYFLGGFDEELGFANYMEDDSIDGEGTWLCKIAGQLCYMSFGEGRTKNKDAKKYFDNILSSGHGSVLEHATYSLLFYGISRSLTHELVRHRAGFGYSQVSQRYVSGKVLRFVERPEYQNDPELHYRFEIRIDTLAAEYESIAEQLLGMQKEGSTILSAERRTDLRKKVQQTARSVLPNETEAPIVVTGNIRAWRHFLEMRASEHAETEIRAVAMKVYRELVHEEPILFNDYEVYMPEDGLEALRTQYEKV